MMVRLKYHTCKRIRAPHEPEGVEEYSTVREAIERGKDIVNLIGTNVYIQAGRFYMVTAAKVSVWSKAKRVMVTIEKGACRE